MFPIRNQALACLSRAVILWTVLSIAPLAAAEPRVVENQGLQYRIAPVPTFVDLVAIPERWPADAPGLDDQRWRVWRLDAQVDRRQGRRVRFYDYAYEVISPELVGEAAKFEVSFNPEFEQLIMHSMEVRRNGKWTSRNIESSITLARRESEFERDMATGEASALLLLKDIRAGDLVRTVYSIEGFNPILAGQLVESASFAWGLPVLHRRLRVLFDRDEDIVEMGEGGPPPAKKIRTAEHQEWRYASAPSAAVRDEQVYPVWFNPYPSVILARRQGWADVAQWAAELYPKPAPLPEELQQRIAAWKALDNPELQIAAALQAVQDEVRYFGVEVGENSHRPHEPAEVWERRFGDCKDKARLLSVLLGEMGISARPALVSTQRGKALSNMPAAGALFDHVIVQVEMEGNQLWLDPTQTQQRGSPTAIDNAYLGVALPVDAEVTALVEVERPAGSKNQTRIHEDYQPEPEGSAVMLTVNSRYVGAAAEMQRREVARTGRDVLSERYADYYRRRFGELEVAAPLQVNDNTEDNTLVITEQYRLAQPWSDKSSSSRVLDVYADSVGAYTALPSVQQRVAPLPIAYPLDIDHVVTLNLPKGWEWASNPASETVADSALSLEYSHVQKDRRVEVHSRLRSASEVVNPEQISEHFALRRSMNDALSRRIVVKVPVANAVGDREKKLNSLLRGLLDER